MNDKGLAYFVAMAEEEKISGVAVLYDVDLAQQLGSLRLVLLG